MVSYIEPKMDARVSCYIERGLLGKDDGTSRAARQEINFLTGRNLDDLFKFSSSF